MKVKGILVILVVSLSLIAAPVCASLAYAQASSRGPAPIAQPLVNEGHYAVKLANALNLTTSHDEAAAENALASIGIEPRNGWISDYPMTPDIIAEVKASTAKAASSGNLQMAAADATGIVDKVSSEMNLPVTIGEESNYSASASSSEYSAPVAGSGLYNEEPTYINNYYVEYGPPVVTYYPPPLDWYWLYTWVPYPFWWDGFGFGGYFILADFDCDFHGEHFSNHFRDSEGRWRAVDPVTRAEGRAASTLTARENNARISRLFHSARAQRAERSLVGHAMANRGVRGSRFNTPNAFRNGAFRTRAGNRINSFRAGRSLSNGNTGRNFTGVNRSFANNRAAISRSAIRPSFSGRSFGSAPSVHAFNGGGFRGAFHGGGGFGGFHAPAFAGGGFHAGGFGGGFHGGGFHGGGFGGFHGGGFGGGFHGGRR